MEQKPTYEDQTNQALIAVNECLLALGKRLEALEKHVNEMPTPDKTYYKPEGEDKYLSLKENLDFIYERLDNLEEYGV
jgi:hypothetical protein|tara:strand:- start:431 stop:664 length:234 start_codon:yes stop_codon:yes gene_type:complete